MLIDTQINSLMLSIENPFLTSVSKIIDFLFEPLLILVISMIISIFLFYRGSKKEAIIFSTSMIFMALLLHFFKELSGRLRPLNFIIFERGYSFPSGHATASIVFLGLIAHLFAKKKSPRIKILTYFTSGFLILLTGFTRIYLRVHWFTDVLFGFLIGGIILIIGILILKKKKF